MMWFSGKNRWMFFLAGAFFVILPSFDAEYSVMYAIAPWISVTCLLYYARTISKKREWFLFALVLLAAYEIRYRSFLGDSDVMYMIMSALLLAVLAAVELLVFLLDRFYQTYSPGVLKVIAFPIARIVMERFVIGQQFNYSLTQFGNKWLIQSAAFVGDVFISFSVAFVPSVIVYMIIKRENRKMIRWGTAVLACYMILFLAGGVRYTFSPVKYPAIHMAYASGPQKTYYEEPSETDPEYEENVQYLRRTTAEAAGNGAKLIAYAEEAFIVNGEEEEELTREACAAAEENDIFILLSLDVTDKDGNYLNKAVLIDNEGKQLSEYLKTNLIPVIEAEDYVAGDGDIPSNRVVIDGHELVISYTVCYDATFSDYLITMDEETDLFINPSWDWEEIVDLNYRMQGLNAIENGVVMFKPTVDGWSMVTDPYGRVVYKESTLRGDYDKVRYADVPQGKTDTLYRRISRPVQWFWSLSALVTASGGIIDCVAYYRRRRNKKIRTAR